MPGLVPGQIYSYPAKRWCKKRRSYLVTYATTPKKKEGLGPAADADSEVPVSLAENSNSAPAHSLAHALAANDEHSKDSTAAVPSKDEGSKVSPTLVDRRKRCCNPTDRDCVCIFLGAQEPWFYEDMHVEGEDFEDPEPDSDYDYEESLSKRKGKKKAAAKTPSKVSCRRLPVCLSSNSSLIGIMSCLGSDLIITADSRSQEADTGQLRRFRSREAVLLRE